MTEPQTITADHVRALLDADAGSTIGLIEGRVEVIGGDQGALTVISREDLVAQLGDDTSDEQLAAQAEALTIQVQQIGG